VAAQPQPLTLAQFDAMYSSQKPYYEYWYGQAIQKAMPTKLHSALQVILALILREIGLLALTELRINLGDEARPLPDVAGFAQPFAGMYPTEPFEAAIEILSPDDSMQYLMRKCRRYAQWGIQNIFVFDPEDRVGLKWNRDTDGLDSISELIVDGRTPVPLSRIWSELDRYTIAGS
jgi:Uma2 family endonuclease